MIAFRRSAFSIFRNGGRVRILLLLIGFGLGLYILLLSNAVPSRTSLPAFNPKPAEVNATAQAPQTPKTAPSEAFILDQMDLTSDNQSALLPSLAADQPDDLPLCSLPQNFSGFEGHLAQATLLIEDLNEDEVMQSYPDIRPGGEWRPAECRAKDKVAIIIPYRDRKSHLTRLLDFLIPILKRQLLDFRFVVTEQFGEDLFNKGRIMNAAFKFAQSLGVDCVIFHDVDMFPQDDRAPYGCPSTPRHLGAFVSNLGYQLWYKEIVGGALSIGIEDYLTVNGYSNNYWGWGGEDDDMGKRILSLNYTIERPNNEHARFTMIKHVKRKRTSPKLVYKLLDSAGTRWTHDGVNETGLWTLKRVQKRPLYYHLLVDVGESPSYWRT